MDCQRIDSMLDEHGIGALSANERSEVERHVERCPRCADAWLAHATLAADRPAAPRTGLYDRIAARAGVGAPGPEPSRPPQIRLPHRWVSSLAAAAAALVLAGLVFRYAIETSAPPGSTQLESAASERESPADRSRPELATGAGGEARFLAGRDYERLPEPAPRMSDTALVEVCEFFMFGCSHCFDFEPRLETWSRRLPEDVDLVRVPVLFNPTARLQAQAYYAAEALGRLDELLLPFYEEIHSQGNALATEPEIREFFGRFGIDGPAFDEAFDSAEVRARLGRAEELNRRYRVVATPSLGVNGRYLTNASMAGSSERALEVVDVLVEAELVERRCAASDDSRCPVD